jgi:hypothetical protein
VDRGVTKAQSPIAGAHFSQLAASKAFAPALRAAKNGRDCPSSLPDAVDVRAWCASPRILTSSIPRPDTLDARRDPLTPLRGPLHVMSAARSTHCAIA